MLRVFCDNNETHGSVLEAAIEEVYAKLETKRVCLESQMPSPSDFGKTINKHKLIYNHRSTSNPALHVGLQVPAFGQFLDTMKSEAEDIPSLFYCVASDLMQNISLSFPSEARRVHCFKYIIKKLGENFKCLTVQGDSYRSDGAIQDNSENFLVNWEFKNEMFGNATCPNEQNIGYFIHMKKGQTGHSPMLLVSVVGCHYLQVFGAAWDGDKRVCVDPLSSPVSLLFVPRDPNHGVSKVAKLLFAMNRAISDLRSHYATSVPMVNNGPYWTKEGLVYKQRMTTVPWLFDAVYYGENVVVKFVRDHYGDKVHRFLAGKNLAPKLHLCERLVGGWYVVIMGKVEGRLLNGYMSDDTLDPYIKESLNSAVQEMHKNRMVHGDLRPQNILITDKSSPVILDFDWAGMEGEATYPAELNETCHWHKGVKARGKIEKEHDQYQINNY